MPFDMPHATVSPRKSLKNASLPVLLNMVDGSQLNFILVFLDQMQYQCLNNAMIVF